MAKTFWKPIPNWLHKFGWSHIENSSTTTRARSTSKGPLAMEVLISPFYDSANTTKKASHYLLQIFSPATCSKMQGASPSSMNPVLPRKRHIFKWSTTISSFKYHQFCILLFVDDQVIIPDTEDNQQKAAHKLTNNGIWLNYICTENKLIYNNKNYK
jgi:hypothetical protein